MNVETIIAIITAGIAFVTSAATLTYNLMQSRKERVQKIILDNRISYMNEMRDGFANVIGLSNAKAIALAKADANVMKTFSQKLFGGYGKIKAYIKPFYKIDKALLDALDSLYDCILALLEGNAEAADSIDALREAFADKYLKYDWAYWKYIQSQRNAGYINSDEDFDKIYYQFVDTVEKGLL